MNYLPSKLVLIFLSLSVTLGACTSTSITPPDVSSGGTTTSIVSSGTSAAAPSGLVVTTGSSTTIGMRWTDNSSDETEFRIYRSFNNSTYTQVATVASDTTRWVDSTLFPSTTYYYKVTAYKSGVGETSGTTGNATTFSGDWKELDGSASLTGSFDGISGTASAQSTFPASATDAAGRIMVVWQENVNGTDQIYGAVYDPDLYDSDGALIGWKPIIINSTISTSSATGTQISAVTYDSKQTSMQGSGISQASGHAQEPAIVYNSTAADFVVAWQEKKSGYFQIMARRIQIEGYNSFAEAFYAQISDSTITDNLAPGGTNEWADDDYTTVASTWILSEVATPAEQQLHVQLASVGAVVYAVWQEYTSSIWQIYGTKSTLTTVGAYPAIPAVPGAAAIVPIDDTGTISNTGTGISQGGAGEHSFYPSIAIAQDSTVASGNNNVYVTWQMLDATSGYWEVKAIGCLALCTGSFGSIIDVASSSSADVQHPKIATTLTGYPVIAFDANTYSSNYEVYARKGDNNSGTLPAAYATITDTITSSGDLTSGGLSNSTGSSQWPSIAIYNQDIYVSWQDGSNGFNNIFVKHYNASVPNETAAWKGMSNSDTGSGVSEITADRGAGLSQIRVSSGGQVDLVWQNWRSNSSSSSTITGYYNIYLKRY